MAGDDASGNAEGDIIVEILAAQAVSCGMSQHSSVDDNAVAPQEKLIDTLQEFNALDKELGSTVDHYQETDDFENRVAAERVASSLRQKIEAFLCFRREKIVEISSFCEELQSSCGSNTMFQRAILRSRSLKVASQKKYFKEKKAINLVSDRLQYLYSDYIEGESALSELCNGLETSLKNHTIQQSTELQGLLLMIERSKQEKRRNKLDTPYCVNHSRLSVARGSGVSLQPRYTPEDTPNFAVDAIRQITCLKPFPLPESRMKFLGMYKMMIVGKAGSGKTLNCDEIVMAGGDTFQGTS